VLVMICILSAFVVRYINYKNMHLMNNIKLYLSKINISYSYKCLLVKRIKVINLTFLFENHVKLECGDVSPLVHDLGIR